MQIVGTVLMGMVKALVTEKMIKFFVIKGLEILVKKTKTTVDDELLKKAKEQWK